MTFRSAYLKLTLFYVLIVMAISISFSLAIYQISSREIGRGLGPESRILRDLIPNNIEDLRSQQINESNSHLKVNLLYYNLIILILSSIGSYFLAKRTLKPIEEAMDTQNRFTADASHELRTPLAAMRAEIEVSLRDKKINFNDSKRLLKSNLEEVEKLENLSNALLKLSHLQEDIKRDFANVSLKETMLEAFEKVEKLADKKNIEFKVKLSDVLVKADKHSLIELFVILLDNAIKYSPGDSKININLEKEASHVVVTIKDEGIGIKAMDLPHIFDRFFRADSSRSKEKVDGYGLGLSIAKQIVELHGGRISVESTPGKGSEFRVIF